jgi:hypothetical protein
MKMVAFLGNAKRARKQLSFINITTNREYFETEVIGYVRNCRMQF